MNNNNNNNKNNRINIGGIFSQANTMKLNQYSHQLSVNLSLCLLLMLVVQVFGFDGTNRIDNNDTNLDNQTQQGKFLLEPTTTTTTTAPTTTITSLSQELATAATGSNSQHRPSTDIVINSLEDGLLVSGKSASDRHHYEQQPNVEQPQQATISVEANGKSPMAQPVPAVTIDELGDSSPTYHGSGKPEPRNQQDEQQDPAIIDHRPSGTESQVVAQQQQQQQQQQQEYVTVQQQQATTQAPYKNTQNSQQLASAPATNIVYTTQTNSQHQQPSQQQQSTVTSWYPQQQQVNYQPMVTYAQAATNTQPAQQQQYSGVLMAQPSNQVISIQHPTSINSIISEHQNQQQQQQQQQAQPSNLQQVIPVNAASTSAASAQPSQQSQQVVSVNGQPMILVNPNTLTGGRRISISGWLKGISSMLANIFNRREHGGQITGQASNSLGHWIQLGPNAPHWLTTAQTVAQQGQYQQQQLQQQLSGGSLRQPLLASAGTNRYTFVPAPVAQQPQATITVGSSPTVAMAPQQQQQQQQQVVAQQQQQQYQTNDLQASGSSTSYATVAPPLSSNQVPTSNLQQQVQQLPQQQVAIGQYAQQANSNIITNPSQQQQQQQQITSPAPVLIVTGSPIQLQPIAQSQNGSVRSTSATSVSSSSAGQSRFGRSMGASSSGLPLAHYSRYATSMD